MKKALFFAGLATASLLFAGCNKEADVKGLDGFPIEIQLSDIDTRTVNDGMSTKWVKDDALTVFYAPTGTTEWSRNTKFTVTDASANRATGDVELTAGAYDWYLFYPYDSYLVSPTSLNEAGENKGYMNIGSKNNGKQTQAGLNSQAHLAGSFLPVHGVRKNVTTGVTPSVLMQHVSSVVAVNVTNGTTKPLTVTGIEFTAPEAIVGSYYIDYSGETLGFKASGNQYVSSKASLTVTGNETIAANGSAKFYLAIKPFAAKAGDKLTLKISAAEGPLEKEITLPSAVEFKSGKIKTLNITYSGGTQLNASTLAEIAEMEANTEVKTQEVLVVAKNARGIMLAQSGTYMQAYFNTAGTDAAIGDIVVVTGKVGTYGGFKQINEPALTKVSTGNDVNLPDAKVLSKLDDYASEKIELIQFTGTLKKSDSYYNIEVSGSTRKGSIQYPNNTEALDALVGKTVTATGFFTGLNNSKTIVNMMSTSVVEPDSPVFGAGYFGTDPVSASTTSVKISISGNVPWWIEKEDETDPLTFDKSSGEGADEVTVSFPVNTTDKAITYVVLVKTDNAILVGSGDDELSVTFTQAAAGTNTGSHYAKVTSITSGKKYLIVGGGQSYAMIPTVTSTVTRPVGTEVTIVDGKITSNTDVDAYAVTITEADGKYSIVLPDNKYLVYSGSGTNLSAADTATDTWTVSAGTYGTFRFVATSNNGRILSYRAQNGDYGNCFGAYASSNVTGAEYFDLDLYELGGVVSTDPVNPALTVPESITVGKGKTEKIAFTTNSDGEMSFVSADPSIATVAEDGTVTGVTAGSTTVTVSVTATQNYKAASATVAVTVTGDEAKKLPYEEAFSNTQGEFTTENKVMPSAMTYVWTPTEKYGMKASAYVGGTAYETESWLISPVVSFAGATHPALSFSHAVNNFTSIAKAQEETSVWIREKDGEWTKLSGVNYPTSLSWTFVESGSIDLSAYVNKQIEIGFKYTSTTEKAGTWEVKDFKLKEAEAGPVAPTLSVTPASVNVVAGNTVKLEVETNSTGAKSFVSSNTDVATVATDGTVTGVAAGSATITVKVAATTSYTEKSVEVPVTVTAATIEGTTLTVTMNDYVEEHNCSHGDNTVYNPLELSPSVRMSTTGDPNCGAFYGTDTYDWRLYQAQKGNVTITVAPGCELKSVKFTYKVKNSGALFDGETKVASGDIKTVSGSSVTYTVGNTGTATNGQVQITAVEVVYTGEGTFPTATLTKIEVSGQTTEYNVGDTFTFDGTVTATYSDNSTKTVTPTEVSKPDMTVAGTPEVTVTYQEGGATATAKYTITVKAAGTSSDAKYSLNPVEGTDNGYANSEDITIGGITWNVTGNSTLVPWRIGGKSLTEVDRAIYSKTAMNYNIGKIEITHGNASNITVNSMTVVVASDADFANVVSELTPTFAANSTVTVEKPVGANWSNCYYKIIYNVSVTGSSNRFIEFAKAEFFE
jgi:hypothetical protein